MEKIKNYLTIIGLIFIVVIMMATISAVVFISRMITILGLGILLVWIYQKIKKII